VVADSTAERRVVEIGFEDDDFAEVLDGIAVDESIVVKGQRSLKHGSPIKILTDETKENIADKKPPRQKGS
jgi:multidrug efflux pump subunit AcrA (membrane-fusion protein)